jgi:hypothetical protein
MTDPQPPDPPVDPGRIYDPDEHPHPLHAKDVETLISKEIG